MHYNYNYTIYSVLVVDQFGGLTAGSVGIISGAIVGVILTALVVITVVVVVVVVLTQKKKKEQHASLSNHTIICAAHSLTVHILFFIALVRSNHMDISYHKIVDGDPIVENTGTYQSNRLLNDDYVCMKSSENVYESGKIECIY